MSDPNQTLRRRVFLWSHPRTTSNLFLRMLDPDVQQFSYNLMMPLMFGPDRRVPSSQTEKSKRLNDILVPKYKDTSMQVAVDELQEWVAKAEAAGKCVVVKEHAASMTRSEVKFGTPGMAIKVEDRLLDLPIDARLISSDKSEGFTNPTLIPDRFVLSFFPVFIIRHPARMVPSYLRAGENAYGMKATDPAFAALTSYKWSRLLYDWYKSRDDCEHGWPIVVDSDELINNAEGIMEQFCELAGWDPKGLRYTWDPEVTEESYHDLSEEKQAWHDSWLGTIDSSTGIQKNEKLLREPVIEEERAKWVATFGEEAADAIVAAVENTMADYNYLRQFCIKG